MPQIKGSDWYTAAGIDIQRIEGSDRHLVHRWFGYRRSLKGLDETEIKSIKLRLMKNGIIVTDKVTQNPHTDIPAGTRILEVSDDKSIANLEKTLANIGIVLPANRFNIYKQLNKQGGR